MNLPPTTHCRNLSELGDTLVKKNNLMFLTRSQTPSLSPVDQFFIFVHDPAIDKHGSGDIIVNKKWHSLVLKALQDVIGKVAERSGHVRVFDIGGNLGFIAMYMASLGEHVRVVSVEPMDLHRSLFKSSLVMNPGISHRITVEGFALAKSPGGTLCMAKDPTNFAASSITLDNNNCDSKVAVSSLEEMCSTYGDPTIIKIDVEGFEPIVFQGGLALLRDRPPQYIISEFVPFRVNASGFSNDPFDFLDFMVDFDYVFTDVVCYAHTRLTDCSGHKLKTKDDIRAYWRKRDSEYKGQYFTDIIWSRD